MFLQRFLSVKIQIDDADSGAPLLLQEKDTPTKTALQKLVSVISEKLPPIEDETCTGSLAKYLRNYQIHEYLSK